MSKSILLIEDDQFIRDLYKRQLTLGGFTISDFSNGTEGLKSAGENSYDAILLDIMLPDINGITILKTLKQSEKTKNIPVIMLTNLGQDAIIKEGFSFGAIGYLIKASFTPDEIVQEVKSILEQQAKSPNPQSASSIK